MRQSRRLAVAWVLLVVPSACADAPNDVPVETSTVVVRDSAGIQIVENQAPIWGDGEGWTIDPEPALEIGALEGEYAYLFQAVAAATLLPDGGVVVGEAGDLTLRFFGPDGVVRRVAAGRGEGPGELRQLRGTFFAGQEVFVHQGSSGDVLVFSESGDYLRTISLPPLRAINTWGVFEDGTLAVRRGPQAVQGLPGIQVDTVDILRVHESGRVDTLAGWPSAQYVDVSAIGAVIRQVWSPTLQEVVSGDRLFLSWPASPEVTMLDPEGQPIRIIRWNRPLESIGDAEREAYIAAQSQPGPDGRPASPRMVMGAEGMTLPETSPSHGKMWPTPSGALWVERFRRDFGGIAAREAEASTFDVFDPDGRWLGPVTTPLGLFIREISDDYILAQIRGDFDVTYVRKYRIDKPTG